MIQLIETQIENVNKSIEWIKKYKKEQFDQKYISLVEERRKLRIMEKAERNNPGIAAFGQSQVGKSYLMNCILKNGDGAFLVDAEDGQHNFVDEINPIGEGSEATGVVTRFSSYTRNETEYDIKYPIRMSVLSVRDMISIICDTYFNEFDDYTTLGENEILQLCNDWKQQYADKENTAQPMLSSDDILNIKYYFKKHINNAQVYSTKTPFFDTLALIIEKIPQNDFVKIFSILWNNNEEYTKLFTRSLDILRKLGFRDYIYLPMQAVLHNGTKEDTIMSVSCLKLLYTDNESMYNTTAFTKEGNAWQQLGSFTKSELCTVCSEVIIKIGKDFISTSGTFDTRMISENSSSQLSVKLSEAIKDGVAQKEVHTDMNTGEKREVITMDVLKSADLLDFPGARARGNMLLIQIKDHDNLMYSFLRGKVAYLFNKYNEEKLINILLFCHHHKNVEAPQMWQLLDEWVKEYVGDTPERREVYIKQLGVSPLFHIGTMWNLNLQNPDNEIVGKTDKSISSRWKERFITQLVEGCFKKAGWVSNWDGHEFQNCYMLRDYKFSTPIYNGWEKNRNEASLAIDLDYYNRMRTLFIKSNEEHHLFSNPELSWDISSSQNNDGSLYILLQLAKVSAKINEVREDQINNQLKACCQIVYSIMRDYHKSTDGEEILEGNIRIAKSVFREMDFTCNSDNYYFGHLIQALQLTETQSYREVHKIMQSPTLNQTVNSFMEYEIIRNSCRKAGFPIEDAKSESEKWEWIVKTYGFLNKDDAEAFLKRKNIDVQKLFSGSYRRKLNSCIIADSVFEKWCSSIKSVDFLNEFSNEDSFDSTIMSNLVDELIATANSFGIRDRMADSIAEYVNVVSIHTANENLLADMLASMINNFVLDFGFSWLTDEEKAKAKKICDKYNIPAFNYITKELPATFDEAALTAMFNEMSSSPKALLPSFEDNYNKWLEYMFISFVAHLNIPDIDPEANNMIKMLLDSIKVAA